MAHTRTVKLKYTAQDFLLRSVTDGLTETLMLRRLKPQPEKHRPPVPDTVAEHGRHMVEEVNCMPSAALGSGLNLRSSLQLRGSNVCDRDGPYRPKVALTPAGLAGPLPIKVAAPWCNPGAIPKINKTNGGSWGNLIPGWPIPASIQTGMAAGYQGAHRSFVTRGK